MNEEERPRPDSEELDGKKGDTAASMEDLRASRLPLEIILHDDRAKPESRRLDNALKVAQLVGLVAAGLWTVIAYTTITKPDREEARREAERETLQASLRTNVRLADSRPNHTSYWFTLEATYHNIGKATILITGVKCILYGGTLALTSETPIVFGYINPPLDHGSRGLLKWTQLGEEMDFFDGVAPLHTNKFPRRPAPRERSVCNEASCLAPGESDTDERTFLIDGTKWPYAWFDVRICYKQETKQQGMKEALWVRAGQIDLAHMSKTDGEQQ